MPTTPLAQVAAVAAKQLSCFTREQGHKCKLSDYQLRRLVRAGVLEAVGPRVFRFAGSAHTWLQQVMAACLDGGPDCVASHRTAAALHRLDGFPRAGTVEVLVPMKVRHRRKDVIVHHTRDLPSIDCTLVGVVPATSVARTLIDLGASQPATVVEEAFDSAERTRSVKRSHVEHRYEALRARGRNGIGAMTLVLHDREPARRVPRSTLERRMFRILERAGLPLPVKRYNVKVAGGRIVELDFAFVAVKLGIEVDGHGAHARRKDRAADNIRAARLGDVGWSLRRFTWEQVMFDEHEVVTTIRRALATAENRL